MNRDKTRSGTNFIIFLRAIAAIIVVFCHLQIIFWNGGVGGVWPFLATEAPVTGMSAVNVAPYLSRLSLDTGSIGVAFFFLITGFLVNISLKKYTSGQFLLVKFLRLIPMYIIGVALTFGCIWLYTNFNGIPFPYTISDFLSQISLSRLFLGLASIDGISWTLVADVEFYLLIALLAKLKKNRSAKGLLLTGAVLTVIAVLYQINAPKLLASGYYVLNRFCYIFTLAAFCMTFMLLGTVIYEHYSGNWDTAKTVAVGSGLYFMFIICALAYSTSAATYIISYSLSLAVFILCYALSRAGHDRAFASPAISVLANISYPLYLVHGLNGYIMLTALYNAGVNHYLSQALTLIAVTAAAFILHYCCEKPIGRLTSKLTKRFRPKQGSSVSLKA